MTYLHDFYDLYLANYQNKENIQLSSLLEIFIILCTWISNTIPDYEITPNFYKVHDILNLLQPLLTNRQRLPLLPHMGFAITGLLGNDIVMFSSFWLLANLLKNSLDTLSLLYSPLPSYILEANKH